MSHAHSIEPSAIVVDVPPSPLPDGLLALSACGSWAIEHASGELRVADHVAFAPPGVVAVAILDRAIWAVVRDGTAHALLRFGRDGAATGGVISLGAFGGNVAIEGARRGGRAALVEGDDRAVLVREREQVSVEELGAGGGDRRILVGSRGVLERRGRELVVRGQTSLPALALPADLTSANVVGGGAIFDGAAAIIELEHRGQRQLLAYDLRSAAPWRRIRLGEARVVAIAERRGLVVLGRGAHIALLDVRAGACACERILRTPPRRVLVDADGAQVLVIDGRGEVTRLDRRLGNGVPRTDDDAVPGSSMPAAESVLPKAATQQESGSQDLPGDSAPATSPEAPGESSRSSAPAPPRDSGIGRPSSTVVVESDHRRAPAADGELVPSGAEELVPSGAEELVPSGAEDKPMPSGDHGEPVPSGPDGELLPPGDHRKPTQLSADHAPMPSGADGGSTPPPPLAADADQTLLAAPPPVMVERIPAPLLGGRELARYLKDAHGFVAALCRTAVSPKASASEPAALSRFGRWDRAGAPHVEVARELGLGPVASLVLQLAAAPCLFGELARLYAQVGDDRARPLVDEYLIAQILGARADARTAIARELDDDAPLRRWGAIEIGPGMRPFAQLTVHPVLLRRLSGVQYDSAGTTRSLAELRAPRAALAELVRALAALPAGCPVRVALGGRTGGGRRTIAAALAQLGGRGVGFIELPPPAPGDAIEVRIRQQLIDTSLRGLVPCLTLDGLGDDPGARDRVRAVLDAFPGPVIVRGPLGAAPPLSPGYLALDLPALSELERAEAWHHALTAHGLTAAPSARLAARFAIEPGTIARVLAGARPAPAADAATVEAVTAASLRQHRAGRLATIASPVTHLASWDDLILSDDMRASLRELVGRVRCRSTVLERWGMARVASSARGITALFQGGPGTGKTMAAGAVARALGFELWRVDLSRVMSKWLGETEKNLGAVFDAAEEGEIILLFDEADSLFGKRTEVRSSHDRYANVEVNYLLQRLDSFSGLAILTTNFGAAIDPAFRRRLSLHLQFPFPDEDERLRLWHAHLPSALPIAGALDLAALAHKYQMSGGYIRNAALRAAYLAAADAAPLSSAHLLHAIEAEYRDRGKLGRGGPLE